MHPAVWGQQKWAENWGGGELGPNLAHLDPSSRFATPDMGRKFGAPPPLGRGQLGPHITQSPGTRSSSTPSGILIHPSIRSTVFAQMTAECPCTLQWDAPSPPSKLPIPMGDLGPHLIQGSLSPPQSSTQTASRSVQRFLQGHYCDRQTDRLTDRPRYLVVNNRPHLRT